MLGLCPGAGVEADGRGGGDVEGLRLAVDGDGDDGVGSAQRLWRQSVGLVAEQPGAGGLQEGLGLEEVEVTASVGGQDGESGVVEGGDGVVEGHAGDHG